MGGDGGSIRRRSDVVKVKRRAIQENDPAVAQRERWMTCALSAKPLEQPVVTCGLGYLYNREAVCLYLANLLSGSQQPIPQFGHVKTLRDVFACNLFYSAGQKQQQQPQPEDAAEVRAFSCPISGIDASGKYPFVRITGCGCVVSQKAVDSVAGGNPAEEQAKEAEPAANDPGASPPASSTVQVMTCIACGKATNPHEGAEFSEKEVEGVPVEAVAQIRGSIPTKAPMTPLNAPPEVVDGLRTELAARADKFQQARAQLKALKKSHKKSAKRKHVESVGVAEADSPRDAPASAMGPEELARRKDRKKLKAAAANGRPPVLSLAAKLALEAEQAARAKMSDNIRSMFMSEEKRQEAPNFASTAMQSPMSRL